MADALVHPLLASNVAFFVTFGIFVVAILVLIVLTLMWVVRRDRSLRAAWRERQQAGTGTGTGAAPGAAPGTGTALDAEQRPPDPTRR